MSTIIDLLYGLGIGFVVCIALIMLYFLVTSIIKDFYGFCFCVLKGAAFLSMIGLLCFTGVLFFQYNFFTAFGFMFVGLAVFIGFFIVFLNWLGIDILADQGTNKAMRRCK